MIALALRGLSGPDFSSSARVTSTLALLALLPFLVPLDLVLYAIKGLRRSLVLGRDETRCPAGHVVGLVGAWECPACRLTREGHGFADCGYCGTRAEVIGCPCGRPILNPLATGFMSWL